MPKKFKRELSKVLFPASRVIFVVCTPCTCFEGQNFNSRAEKVLNLEKICSPDTSTMKLDIAMQSPHMIVNGNVIGRF